MKKLLVFSVTTALLFTSCDTSKITNSWKAEGAQPIGYKKIVVVALTRNEQRSLRQYMESYLAGDLNALGYNAVTSVSAFGPDLFKGLNEKEAVEKIKSIGADAVVTIVLVDKTEHAGYYNTAPSIRFPYEPLVDRFKRYNTTYFTDEYAASKYGRIENFYWETNLYDLGSQNLIYSVNTSSLDPGSYQKMGSEYGQLIVDNMVDKQVVVKRKS